MRLAGSAGSFVGVADDGQRQGGFDEVGIGGVGEIDEDHGVARIQKVLDALEAGCKSLRF